MVVRDEARAGDVCRDRECLAVVPSRAVDRMGRIGGGTYRDNACLKKLRINRDSQAKPPALPTQLVCLQWWGRPSACRARLRAYLSQVLTIAALIGAGSKR